MRALVDVKRFLEFRESGEPGGEPLPGRGAPPCLLFKSGGGPLVDCGGRARPVLGLGLGHFNSAGVRGVVPEALQAGYRALDTAAIYNNEDGLGQALLEAREELGVSREELFITTKLWNDSHSYDAALRAAEASLARLGLDYVDLFLIHWPAPGRNRYVEAWRALLKLKKEGRLRVAGVSNFLPEHIDRLMDETGEKPALNQLEVHPGFQQKELCAAMEKRGLLVEAWSPLGGGGALNAPLFRKLALKYGKTPAQIILRWHLEQGRPAVPRSSHPRHLRENLDIFDFRLDAEDMRQIALLDSRRRLGPDPATFQ
ncbi:MAG: aldo/keto reductase [Candidatus Adiutrix sp.]|jgi:diketogulonate reductase-like aldo/keto reductase|nr:aldo/keto reductase [Candidatus Adiutrix sp.]